MPKMTTTTTTTMIAINPPRESWKLSLSSPDAPPAFPVSPLEASPGPAPSPDVCCGVAVCNEANIEEADICAGVSDVEAEAGEEGVDKTLDDEWGIPVKKGKKKGGGSGNTPVTPNAAKGDAKGDKGEVDEWAPAGKKGKKKGKR